MGYQQVLYINNKQTLAMIVVILYNQYMKNQQRGFMALFLLAIIALLAVGGAYYYIQKTSTVESPVPVVVNPPTPITPESATKLPSTKEFRAGFNTTATTKTTKPWRAYDPLVSGWFEGTDQMYYGFNYPENVSVQTSADHKTITLTNITTTKVHTIRISYEGGRGYAPKDMYEDIKHTCADCVVVPNKISIKNSPDLITVAGDGKEWIIFSPPNRVPWLITASLASVDKTIEELISTFTFIVPAVPVKYNDPAGHFQLNYSPDIFSPVSVSEVLPGSTTALPVTKFIGAERVADMGKPACSYGLKGGPKTDMCAAEKELGVSIGVFSGSVESLTAGLDPTLKKDVPFLTEKSYLSKFSVMYTFGAEGMNTEYIYFPFTADKTLVIKRHYEDGKSPTYLQITQIVPTIISR